MRLAAVLLLLTACAAHAQGARYRVEGQGPEGACAGTALVTPEPAGERVIVSLKTVGPDGDERRGLGAVAQRSFDRLAFDLAASRGLITEPRLRARARRTAPGVLEVVYQDAEARVVRRETWRRDEDVVVPLVVVALGGASGFQGVSAEDAAGAQRTILEQLDGVFAPCRVRFAATGEPALLPGAAYDADQDGRLGRPEVARLRDDLEARELKRPGRVVLVLTASPLVGRGCRGWTIGDAPATPHSLEDVNDNFSLVGARWLRNQHTVAHEVGHQLGLDDLGAENRALLERRDRADQLMESGGAGWFLDPALVALVRRNARWPDHGLDGRRVLQVARD